MEKSQQEAPRPGQRQRRDSSVTSGSISFREEKLRGKDTSLVDQSATQEPSGPELLQRLSQVNDFHEKLVNSQAFAAKTESYNMVLLKQTSQQEKEIQELRNELDDLLKKEINDSKL